MVILGSLLNNVPEWELNNSPETDGEGWKSILRVKIPVLSAFYFFFPINYLNRDVSPHCILRLFEEDRREVMQDTKEGTGRDEEGDRVGMAWQDDACSLQQQSRRRGKGLAVGVGAGELMFAVATAGLCRQGCYKLLTHCPRPSGCDREPFGLGGSPVGGGFTAFRPAAPRLRYLSVSGVKNEIKKRDWGPWTPPHPSVPTLITNCSPSPGHPLHPQRPVWSHKNPYLL